MLTPLFIRHDGNRRGCKDLISRFANKIMLRKGDNVIEHRGCSSKHANKSEALIESVDIADMVIFSPPKHVIFLQS